MWGYTMSYDYQKDLKEVVDKAVKKYGSMEKAIFEMNGRILDLRTTLAGIRKLEFDNDMKELEKDGLLTIVEFPDDPQE